jgi:hypothetical protein
VPRLSNQSAHLRGNDSVYESLIRQASTMRILLREKLEQGEGQS